MKAKNRKYRIGDIDLYFRKCLTGYIAFEKLAGKSVDAIESLEDIILLVYALTKAGMAKEKKPFDYTYEQFLELVDNYPGVIKELAEDDSEGEKK